MTDQQSIQTFQSDVKKKTAIFTNQPTRQDTLKQVVATLKTAETVGGDIDKVWKEVFAKRQAIGREIAETKALVDSLVTDFSQRYDEAITAEAFQQVDAEITALSEKIVQEQDDLATAKGLLDEKKRAVAAAENEFKSVQNYWTQRGKDVKDIREKIAKWKADAGAALDTDDEVKAFDLINKLMTAVMQLDTWSDPAQNEVTNLANTLDQLLAQLDTALKAYLVQADAVDQQLQVLDIDTKALESKQSERFNQIRAVIEQMAADADNQEPAVSKEPAVSQERASWGGSDESAQQATEQSHPIS